MAFYVVVGASGNTGLACVKELLRRGQHVHAVVRSVENAAKLSALGADPIVADITDVKALTAAFVGSLGAYILTPPHYTEADMLAHSLVLSKCLVSAAEAAKLPFLVALSSVGGERAEGTGLIAHAHGYEQLLKASDLKHYVVLRAPGFMDNWARGLKSVMEQGVLPSMYTDPDRKMPQASSKDIGRVAAELLLEGASAEHPRRVVELHGPEDYSVRDAANAYAALLGREVTVSVVPQEKQEAVYVSMGMSPVNAKTFADMWRGFNDGYIAFEGIHDTRRGIVTMREAIKAIVDGS